MIDCSKCSHKPICDWAANNTAAFKLPSESGKCGMYDPCGTCAHKKCNQENPRANGALWEEKVDE